MTFHGTGEFSSVFRISRMQFKVRNSHHFCLVLAAFPKNVLLRAFELNGNKLLQQQKNLGLVGLIFCSLWSEIIFKITPRDCVFSVLRIWGFLKRFFTQ